MTFDKALKLAQAIETASKDVKDLQSLECAPSHTRAPHSVLKMSTQQIPSGRQHQHTACCRCGGEQHRAGDCRFIKQTCHRCGKVGHIQKVCRSKGSASNSKTRGGGVQTGKQGRELRGQMMSDRGRKTKMVWIQMKSCSHCTK